MTLEEELWKRHQMAIIARMDANLEALRRQFLDELDRDGILKRHPAATDTMNRVGMHINSCRYELSSVMNFLNELPPPRYGAPVTDEIEYDPGPIKYQGQVKP